MRTAELGSKMRNPVNDGRKQTVISPLRPVIAGRLSAHRAAISNSFSSQSIRKRFQNLQYAQIPLRKPARKNHPSHLFPVKKAAAPKFGAAAFI